jgi:phage shock protein C
MPESIRRLYRSRTDRKIAGVCGGLAAYWGIDPVIPRLIWVAFALAAGAGIVAYIVCWLVIPKEPAGRPVASS